MPLVRVSHPAGLDPGALGRGVREALVATLDMPPDDCFQIVTEHAPRGHAPGGIVRPESDLGIRDSDRPTVAQITADDTPTHGRKRALDRAVADDLAREAGLRREDVPIGLVEVARESGSFGNGGAQYARDPTPGVGGGAK